MKTYTNLLIALFILLLVTNAQAQEDTTKQRKDAVRSAADLKTGNSQDVLISFFQLAVNDLTGNEKTFKFQSSLFAIKAKTDDDLWIDKNYLKQKFARNFVFSVAPQLDSNFHFKASTVGLKYALVNNRDKTVFDFATDDGVEHATIKNAVLKDYLALHNNDVTNADYKKARNYFVDKNDPDEPQTPFNDLPADFVPLLEKYITQSKHFKHFTLEAFQGSMDADYAKLVSYVESRALWTVESNFSTNNNGNLFSAVNISSQYLKGLNPNSSKMSVELDLQSAIDFTKDSISLNKADLNRQVFTFSGGFNWIILKNKNKKSIIELKGLITYNNVLRGKYLNEDYDKFTADATLRVRITDDIWIPVDIKYDPSNGNVLGFLNIRSNFDWLGRK